MGRRYESEDRSQVRTSVRSVAKGFIQRSMKSGGREVGNASYAEVSPTPRRETVARDWAEARACRRTLFHGACRRTGSGARRPVPALRGLAGTDPAAQSGCAQAATPRLQV